MMATIYKWKRMALPDETSLCVQRLVRADVAGRLKGLAFVALLDDKDFVAHTCGLASEDLEGTRILLREFDTKLAKRQMNKR